MTQHEILEKLKEGRVTADEALLYVDSQNNFKTLLREEGLDHLLSGNERNENATEGWVLEKSAEEEEAERKKAEEEEALSGNFSMGS